MKTFGWNLRLDFIDKILVYLVFHRFEVIVRYSRCVNDTQIAYGFMLDLLFIRATCLSTYYELIFNIFIKLSFTVNWFDLFQKSRFTWVFGTTCNKTDLHIAIFFVFFVFPCNGTLLALYFFDSVKYPWACLVNFFVDSRYIDTLQFFFWALFWIVRPTVNKILWDWYVLCHFFFLLICFEFQATFEPYGPILFFWLW